MKSLPAEMPSEWDVPAFTKNTLLPKANGHALVIPVLNEGERIRAQLRRIKQQAPPVDVIIADGGSTDGALDADFLKETGVRAVLTKTGPGKLSAQLRMAYAWCLVQGYSGIVTMDGNGKDNASAIADFVGELEAGYDYVQGSRYRKGGQAVNTPFERTIGNRLIHAPLMSMAGRRAFTDTTNGFRAYSRAYLMDERVAPFRDVFLNYELLFYLTVRAGQLGYRVREIPVERRYPRDGATPTKIQSFGAKMALLRQAVRVALGAFTPGSSVERPR